MLPEEEAQAHYQYNFVLLYKIFIIFIYGDHWPNQQLLRVMAWIAVATTQPVWWRHQQWLLAKKQKRKLKVLWVLKSWFICSFLFQLLYCRTAYCLCVFTYICRPYPVAMYQASKSSSWHLWPFLEINCTSTMPQHFLHCLRCCRHIYQELELEKLYKEINKNKK